MKLIQLSPTQILNKALLSHRVAEGDMKKFTTQLSALIAKINEAESEENQKTPVRDFLKQTFYAANEVNTKERIDLAIHKGATNHTPVAVLIEVKKPSNKNEMLSAEKPNRKALQELVLYYMRERTEAKNTNIQHLIATNIYEWYVIDANYFEQFFYKNTAFRKEYEEWASNKKSSEKTDFFYHDIAKPFIENLEEDLPCAYFDLRDYTQKLGNQQDASLQALYKILSPQHLLHVEFANDGNELNEGFYRELLHIIGLEEVKEGGKSIIRRKAENRNTGALLELVLDEIKTEGLHKVPDIQAFGTNTEERYFNVALELCITWINRILFLKLLEGQLLAYHEDDQRYRFLNSAMIHDFDELFKLFHKVLAINVADRNSNIQQKYANVPYLNSSLFEISDLEDCSIKINALDNSEVLPFYAKTILTERHAKKDQLTSLAYLFQFLDAYDFSGEGSKGIVKDNKALINASVLGKVFEKINGYKDGSVYTPAFITMYMCKQSLEMAVVEKFNTEKGWNCLTFNDLENKDFGNQKEIEEANTLINSLKICDPAVGSGHFLVSALNELLLIKYKLGILCDKEKQRIKKSVYQFEIINDELIVTEDGKKTRYNPNNAESQRLQETLFREKQLLIENCLFGVDINPNSVKICRLRLWIELLKNAYYKLSLPFGEGRGGAFSLPFGEGRGGASLETLPNIDINIKCGNSLLSRFALDADLSKALKSIKYNMAAYRGFVQDYKTCKDRDAKRGLMLILDQIKSDFRTEILKNDPKLLRLSKLGGDLYNLVQPSLFEEDAKTKKARLEKIAKLEPEIHKLTQEIENIKTNATFKNAFEWRFEFPEVLDNDGNFQGFDVVIGNPPYISAKDLVENYEKERTLLNSSIEYKTLHQKWDIYIPFIEKGLSLTKNGLCSYIIPYPYINQTYGKSSRDFIVNENTLIELVDLSKQKIFDNAVVTNCIITVKKGISQENYDIKISKIEDLNIYFDKKVESKYFINENGIFDFQDNKINFLKNKNYKRLGEYAFISIGMVLNADENKIKGAFKKDELISLVKTEIHKKTYLEAKNIDKYTIKKIRYLEWDTKRVPSLIRRPTFVELYENDKLLINKIGEIKATFDAEHIYCDQTIRILILWKDLKNVQNNSINNSVTKYSEYKRDKLEGFSENISLKFILGILNSKLGNHLLNSIRGVGNIDINPEYIKNIPIVETSIASQQPIITLVNEILQHKATGAATTALEKELDVLVYGLYELSAGEIAIVEGA